MTKVKQSLVFAAADTVKSGKICENGLINSIVLVLPDFATAATAVLTVKDSDGYTIYTSSGQTVDDTKLLNELAIPCEMNSSYDLTLNAGAGVGGGTATVIIYIENR